MPSLNASTRSLFVQITRLGSNLAQIAQILVHGPQGRCQAPLLVNCGELNKNSEQSATATSTHKTHSAGALLAMVGVGWLVGGWLACWLVLVG